jgi:hypothetical protein
VNMIAALLLTVMLVTTAGGPQAIAPPAPDSERDQMLRKAFGADCAEVRRSIKLLVRDKGLVLAAEQMTIESDGKIKCAQCSLARFSGKATDKEARQLTAIQSEWALLTLDGQVERISDLGTRRIISIEFPGGTRMNFEKK